MYYSWTDNRINAKVVFWGATDAGTTSTIHTLSDRVSEFVDAGDAEPPGPEKAVGMRRNHRPVEINEPDRKLTVYFLHPPGELGEFEGHDLHYKCVTPEGDSEQNQAYAGVFDGVTAIVLTLDARRHRQEANRDAVERLAGHLQRRFDLETSTTSGVIDEVARDIALVAQINRSDAESALPAAEIIDHLRLPDIPTVQTPQMTEHDVWPLMETLRDALQPHLEDARQRGAIPDD